MALKFRGSSQIRDASVSLDKIAHVPSKTVLGRKLDSSGEMSSLNSSDFRDVAELSPSHDVKFNSMTANTVKANSSLVSLDSLDVNGVDSAGLTTLTQTLSANGAGNTLNDAEITSSMDALGTSTLNSGLVVSTNPLITDTMTVGNVGDVGNIATITGNMDLVDSSGTLTSDRLDVNGDLTLTSYFENDDLNSQLISSNVKIDGGVIDAEIGSNVAASGKFSTLISSSLDVGGDLLQVSSNKDANFETDNLKISDPLLLLGKDNPADVLDLGLIFSYGVTPASTYAILNGSFDNGLSDWETGISGTTSSVNHNSNNNNVTIVAQNVNTGGSNSGALLYQRVEFTPNAGKQYRFKFTVVSNYSHPNSQIMLSYWDLNTTPVASTVYGPILNKPVGQSSMSNGGVVESELLDMNTEGLSGGFHISIRTHTNMQSYIDSDSITIDDVKLYEYDPVTDTEVEFTNPITAGFSGIIRDADQEDGINKFKLFDTQADLSDTSNVDFSNGNLGVLDSHIKGNIKFRDAVSIGFDSSGDVSGSAMFYGNNDVAINTTVNIDAVQYDDIDFLSLDSSMEGSSASDQKISSEKAIKSYTDNQISLSGNSEGSMQVMEIKVASAAENGNVSFIKVKETIECIDCDSSNSDVSTEVILLSNNYNSEFMSMSKVFMNGQKLRYGAEYDYILQNNNELKILSDILTIGDQFEVRYFEEVSSTSGSTSGTSGGITGGTDGGSTPTYPDPADYSDVEIWQSTPESPLANGDFENGIDGWDDYSTADLPGFDFETSWDEVNKRMKLCISQAAGNTYRARAAQTINYPFVDGESYKLKFNVYYDPNTITGNTRIRPTVWGTNEDPTGIYSHAIDDIVVNTLTVGQQVSLDFIADSSTVDQIKVGAQLQNPSYPDANQCVSIDNVMLTDANDVPLTRSITMIVDNSASMSYEYSGYPEGYMLEGTHMGVNIQTVGWPTGIRIPFYFDTDLAEGEFYGSVVGTGQSHLGIPDESIKKGSGKHVLGTDPNTGEEFFSDGNRFQTDGAGNGTLAFFIPENVLCAQKSFEIYIPHPEDGENNKLASVSGPVLLSQSQSNIDWRNANCGTPTYSNVSMFNTTPCPGDEDTLTLNGTNMTSGSSTGTYSINGGAAVSFNITEASSQFVAQINVGDSWVVTIPTSGDDVVFSGTSQPDSEC